MKKNVMMRLASGLLVAVLLTTCAISGTFAKYVSTGSGFDTARVAKWGVTIDGSGMTAFKTDYDAAGGTVQSSTTEKLVAPGTSGSFSNFEINGIPEVAVEITYGATVKLSGNWLDETAKFYCPLKVYVNGTPLCGLQYASAAEFEQAIVDNVVAIRNTYAAKTDLSDVEDDLGISWAWSFVSDGTDYNGSGTEGGVQTDVADTNLGNWAADADASNDPAIRIDVTCTITQID